MQKKQQKRKKNQLPKKMNLNQKVYAEETIEEETSKQGRKDIQKI